MALRIMNFKTLTSQNHVLTRCLQGKNPQLSSLRSLITLQPQHTDTQDQTKMFTEVLEKAQKNICAGGSNCPVEFLSSIVPQSQDDLPPRSMQDSLTHALIPIGSNPDVRLKYTSHIGGARLGRLLQDMDNFAALVVYNHISNPLQKADGLTAHAVVTARMDHLHLKENIRNDADIRLVGHVTWVGSSSAEVGINMCQFDDAGAWKHVCEARFVMVARDAATGTKSAPINPLVVKTPEEKFLFKLGENNIAQRAKAALDSLFKEPPSKLENDLIHHMFLSTVDHKARSFSARVKPENGKWMKESKLKSVMLCEPEHKNDYNKIFGGLIMEKCMDLAFVNTWVYSGTDKVPVCTHIDDVIFNKAVEIGDLLYFHSQVVFTHENMVQTRVSAEVLHRETKRLKLTNVLQITWELPDIVPHIVPQTYSETMAYLTGRRHFLISREKEGLFEFDAHVKDLVPEVAKYVPLWSLKPQLGEELAVTKKNNVQALLEEDVFGQEDGFMQAEMTEKIRAREDCAV